MVPLSLITPARCNSLRRSPAKSAIRLIHSTIQSQCKSSKAILNKTSTVLDRESSTTKRNKNRKVKDVLSLQASSRSGYGIHYRKRGCYRLESTTRAPIQDFCEQTMTLRRMCSNGRIHSLIRQDAKRYSTTENRTEVPFTLNKLESMLAWWRHTTRVSTCRLLITL